ncbi:MAG TPA: TMEM175 family protein [Candidatus Baltobacteraceae bacterium]|nr:TMEM175 family protein [Candidatus Baltobacteraceae bacterium]
MSLTYNQIAGRSAERLAGLSDGVFAFAMTLLVLDLRTPELEAIHNESDLQTALLGLVPNLLTYISSFMILGILWLGQQAQLSKLKHSTRDLTWIHLGILFLVTMVPFSTKLFAAYITYRTALAVYWLNILAMGVALSWTWHYVGKANLLKEDAPPAFYASVRNRIIFAQSLYAVGVALCVFNTYVSIVFIIVVQLAFIVGPRTRLLSRL